MKFRKGDIVFCHAITYIFSSVEPQCGTIIYKCPSWLNWLLSLFILHTDDNPIFYYIKCQDGINRFNIESSLENIDKQLDFFKFILNRKIDYNNKEELSATIRIKHWNNLIESYKKTLFY